MNTPNAEPTTVRIADLVLHEDFQVRKELNKAFIERYRQAYQADRPMPPIRVAVVEGAACVVDGWHRVTAAKALGRTKLSAIVTEMTAAQAQWAAAEANLAHGLPLKGKERRNVFRVYVRTKQNRDRYGRPKSYRDMHKEIGISHSTLQRWMEEDFPATFREMGGEDAGGDKGGTKDLKRKTLADHATEHLEQARAAARGAKGQRERGALVALAREVLAEIEAGGKYTIPNDDDDF